MSPSNGNGIKAHKNSIGEIRYLSDGSKALSLTFVTTVATIDLYQYCDDTLCTTEGHKEEVAEFIPVKVAHLTPA